MARMLGYSERPWCPYHRSKGFGLDCPDASCSKRTAKTREKRAWQREVRSELNAAFRRGARSLRLF